MMVVYIPSVVVNRGRVDFEAFDFFYIVYSVQVLMIFFFKLRSSLPITRSNA